MKTFSNFIVEAAGSGFAQMSDADFERWVKANPAAAEKARKIRDKFKQTYDDAKGRTGGGQQKPPAQPPGGQQKPPKPNRATSFARGAGRFGAATAADVGTELAISQIKDPTQQEVARTAKDLALTYAAPVSSLVNMQGSTPQRQTYQADKTTQVSLPANYGSANYEADPNNPRNAIYVQRTKPTKTDDQLYDPNNPLDVRKWKFQAGSPKPVGKPERYGVAVRGGQRELVPYGSVAGQKKVGTTLDVQAKAARERMRATQAKVPQPKRVYGATQGSAIVGTGGKTTFDTKKNTITTGGKTAQLPKTKILPGGGVGDLAYRNGKPVYLARASMAQRGNQSLLARVSRATGIGGQRERDQAALNKERTQAIQNTLRYRQQLGITGTGVSKPPAAKPSSAKSAQAYAASKGKYYSSTTGKTYANYAAALKDPAVRAASKK